MILLRLSIGKFGSSFARPVSQGEGKMSPTVPSRDIIFFIHFLFVGDFSFIRGCRKHECTHEANRARSCCLLGLEVIKSNKSLCIRPSYICCHDFHRPILMFDFARKMLFRLAFRYYFIVIFVYSVSPARLGASFSTYRSSETGKIVFLFSLVYLSFLWKVLLGISM